MTESIQIQRLYKITEDEIAQLVDISSAEGHNNIRRLKEEYFAEVNKFDDVGETLCGAFQGRELIGICGLNRD